MRKFAISDIHGSYNELIDLLNYTKFNPYKDQLVFLGDFINRGPGSGKVLKKIIHLTSKFPENVIAVIGNHEEMMLNYCNESDLMWLEHGGKESIISINDAFAGNIPFLLDWLTQLPLTFEDERFVYAHAGISYPYGQTIKQDREILWMSKSEFYSFEKEMLLHFTKNKPIVHGHTPERYAFFDGARISIDHGAQIYQEKPRLALIELSEFVSYVYNFDEKKITKERIKTR